MIFKVKPKELITAFNELFKDREAFSYQNEVDKLFNKIDFNANQKSWIAYIQDFIIYGSSDYKGGELIHHLNKIEYENIKYVYFYYKLLIEFQIIDFKEIQINVKDQNSASYLMQRFFDNLFDILKNDDKSQKAQFEELDNIAKKINLIDNLHRQGKIKSVTAVLRGKRKSKTFRVNNLDDQLNFEIKKIKPEESRNIVCPVCNEKKEINSNNIGKIFVSKKNRIEFLCGHEKSEFYGKQKVLLSVKEFQKDLKLQGIDEVDFVIYNYQYFFKKFLDENE